MKSICALCQKEIVQQPAHDEEQHEGEDQIMLNATGLDRAQLHTAPPGQVSRTITKEFVDHRDIEIIAHDRTQALCCRAEEVQNAVDQTQVHELVDDVLSKPGDG